MSAELFSLEQFLQLFPSFFAILLCVLSKLDRLWIDAKLQNEIARGASPDLTRIASAKEIANGAAALNIHIVNVVLFFTGAVFAILDWPPCGLMLVWPVITCVILFTVVLYDVLITSMEAPFAAFDRKPIEPNTSRCGLWRWIRNQRPSVRLRWEQIAFNLIIIGLIIVGVELGGAKDARGLCKVESPRIPATLKVPPATGH